MSNDFYTKTGAPATASAGSSATQRAEFALIEAAFDKFPTLTANAGKALVVAAGGAAIALTVGTFALAGNFATTGAFNTTLIQGASVSLTLPVVNGTLATLAGTETFTNKTLNSPTLVTPALGTPASGVLTNCTGTASGLTAGNATLAATASAVALGGVTGLGTGVATALAIAVGSAGGPVVFNGAGGTPSSIVLTNATGTAASLTAGAATLAAAATTVTAANEASDTTCFPLFVTAATGNLGAKTNAGLAFNSSTGVLTATGFAGPITGNASTATALATARAIYGNNFDGTAALTQIIASTFGGTGNGFTKFSGPTTAERTFTLPNASATILTDNAVVTVTQGGSGRATGTTAYGLIAAGTTATGAQQTLAAGATTEMLVGGGASALPVWTTATGSGSPVRATAPTLTNPAYTDQTLTWSAGGTTTWDMNSGGIASVTAGAGNTTMGAPTNLKKGIYVLHFIQAATPRSITWNAVFKWPGGVAPALTQTSGYRDIFTFVCDGTSLFGSSTPGYTS